MWENFKQWVAAPYQENMSALHWFYFFGLLIVIAAAWNLILREIRQHVT